MNMSSRLNQAMPGFGVGQSERGREERQRTMRVGQERLPSRARERTRTEGENRTKNDRAKRKGAKRALD